MCRVSLAYWLTWEGLRKKMQQHEHLWCDWCFLPVINALIPFRSLIPPVKSVRNSFKDWIEVPEQKEGRTQLHSWHFLLAISVWNKRLSITWLSKGERTSSNSVRRAFLLNRISLSLFCCRIWNYRTKFLRSSVRCTSCRVARVLDVENIERVHREKRCCRKRRRKMFLLQHVFSISLLSFTSHLSFDCLCVTPCHFRSKVYREKELEETRKGDVISEDDAFYTSFVRGLFLVFVLFLSKEILSFHPLFRRIDSCLQAFKTAQSWMKTSFYRYFMYVCLLYSIRSIRHDYRFLVCVSVVHFEVYNREFDVLKSTA